MAPHPITATAGALVEGGERGARVSDEVTMYPRGSKRQANFKDTGVEKNVVELLRRYDSVEG